MVLACLDLLCTGVVLLDAQGLIRYVNTAAEELFGQSRQQLLGEPAALQFNVDEPWKAQFLHAIEGDLGIVYQDVAVAGATLGLTIVPLHEQPWLALLELRPIHQHTMLDRRQMLANELGAQRESLRNLAHEINNPLGGLRGAAQLAQDEFDDPGLHEYTQIIIAEADRLKALVDRLLISQAQPRHTERFNIHEVCERAASLIDVEFGSGISLERDYDASVPELQGDAARLLQSLLNVVRNAAQALTESPSTDSACIVLRTRVGRQASLPNSRGLGCVISVIDNGPGVPPAMADKIWHPLVTGRAGGTGLGLSLAQEYLQQMGGLLELESRPGHTEFRLIVPLERA